MYRKISIFLPLLCCCLTSVASQHRHTYYHYPVPSNPVDYSAAARLHRGNGVHRQVYNNYVPQIVARNYKQYPHAASTSTHAQVAQQFSTPDLDNAAFFGALTQHGFNIVESASVTVPNAAAVGAETHSLNVKLPLPLGIAPISVAPLPLQAGGPFNAARDYVTSYGTRDVQRLKK